MAQLFSIEGFKLTGYTFFTIFNKKMAHTCTNSHPTHYPGTKLPKPSSISPKNILLVTDKYININCY